MPSIVPSRFRRPVLLTATALALLSLMPGCAYEGGGRQLPQLDYQNIAPLYVSVGHVDVSTTYVPPVASSQAASAFITPPDVALRRYAEGRLKAHGYEGSLKFTIEEANLAHKVVEPDNSVMQWAQVGKQDRYDLTIRIRMTDIAPNGEQPKDSTIELTRFITVPQGDSIAKREAALRDFMQGVVSEIDRMVTTALQDRMHLAVSGDSGDMPAATVDIKPAPALPAQHVPVVQPEALPPPW